MIQDFTDRPLQRRPRIGLYGWISKIYGTLETTLVILYGTHIVGKNFYGPEYNGIAVFNNYKRVRDFIARESSGYYGPTDKQLRAFDIIVGFSDVQLSDWIMDGCPDSGLVSRATCPECGGPLECDLHMVSKGVPLYHNLSGALDWKGEDENEDVSAIGFECIYCPNCDEEIDIA